MINYVKKEIDEHQNIYYRNKKGQFHRIDGPAIIWSNGDKIWCINGLFHRTDGPAQEYEDGSRYWWINDINYEEEDFLYLTEHKEKYDYKL